MVAYRLKDYAGGDTWGDIVVALNANKEARTINIPKGKYTIVCCDGKINEEGLGTVSGPTVTVPAQSALILHN